MFRLYFFAIIPDDQLCKEITELKNYFARNYFSKAALKLPPHITLYPPFKWNDKNENSLTVSIDEFIKGKTPFSISLSGFGCFEPRVIFIKPEPCIELNNLRKEFLLHLKSTINLSDPQNERPFHPHITLASRDMHKEYFFKAWDEFENKKISEAFNVSSIELLKHDGKHWNIFKVFNFSQ